MKKSLVLGLCTVLVAGFAQADQYDDMVTKGLITPEIAVAKRLAVQEAAVKAPEVIVTSKALTGTATPVKSADQRVRPETTRSTPRVVGPLIAPELISNRAPGNLSAAELEIQALKSIGAEVPAYLYETVNAEHGIVPQRDPEVDPSRQGGDDIAAAVVIPSLPYSNSGTTVGYTNDYDSECPYTGSTSPDVVYSFTPGANVTVDLTLCAGATNYDSKLYVFADSPATVVACNDDACSSPAFSSYVSQLVGVSLTAGTTYYIVVDGYGGQSGSYFLDITEGAPPCVDPGCPAGYTVAELEGACADTNGGCNAAVPAYEPLAFGDDVCGTTWADVNRDTDWYEVLLPEDGIIDITLAAGCVPMNAYVLNTDCDALTVLGSAVALPNGTGTGVSECLPAGQYYVFAGPGDAVGGIFTGFPCDAMNPWHYGIEVNYTPCEYAPPCDTFVNSPIDPFTGVSLTGVSTVGAPDILDLGNGQVGYNFTAADWFTLDVNTCLAGTAFDTDSYLFYGDPCTDGVPVLYNDGSCELTAFATNFVSECLPGGNYTLVIGGFGTGDEGLFDIDINAALCSCAPVECVGTSEMEPNDGCPDVNGAECGTTYCGTVSATYDVNETLVYDVDFYELILGTSSILDITANADGADLLLSFLSGDCTTITDQANVTGYCGSESLTTDCLPAGVYYVAVSALGYWVDTTGNYSLNVTCTPCEIIDPCTNVTDLTLPVVDLLGSTVDSGNLYGNAANDVIYSFTADTDCDVIVSLCGSSYDTYLRAYDTTSPCDGGVEFTSNDDACGLQSELTFPVVSGTTYFVLVEGYGSNNGDYILNIACAAPPVDPCDPILGLSIPAVDVMGSTSNTADIYGGLANEVVYEFVAPYSCDLNVSLCGSSFDTYLYVFEGTSPCDGGTDFAFNDDFCGLQSELTFPMVGGTTYYIVVSGFSSNNGDFILNASCPVLPCDPVTDLSVIKQGGNVILNWTPVAGATEYKIYESADAYTLGTLIDTIPGTSAGYVISGPKKFYTVVVVCP